MTMPVKCFHEPVPPYMQRLLMMGARFIVGNTGEGGEPSGGDNAGGQEDPPADPPANGEVTSDPKDEEKLGEGGKKALDSERESRKAAEKRASEAEAALKKYQDAEKTELQRAQESATDTATGLDKTQRELWLYKALADHPVPEEHRHLIQGNTEEEVLAAAESISQLANRPGVVKESGSNGNGGNTGSSISTGRDLFRERRNRNRKD